MEGSAVKELPLSTRNFTQLLALSPGTSGPLNDAGSLGRGTQNISSGGARLGSNAVYIDGVFKANFNLQSSSKVARRIVASWTWSTLGTHTYELRNVGTTALTLDAFIVFR